MPDPETTQQVNPNIPWEDRQTLTTSEFAALCREHCRRPAQGFDDGRACGSVDGEGDERTYRFCGWHWGAVIGHD